MLTVEEAQDRILSSVSPLGVESCPLLRCRGRALALDVISQVQSPPFANSAMDGYAVLSADLAGASESEPAGLRVLGDVPAGSVGAWTVVSGTAVRIMTGAPVPAGADSVVMVEDTRSEGDLVCVWAPTQPGENVRPAGEDIDVGDRVLDAGTELGPAQIAVAATLGLRELAAVARPRVALLTTGDEVVEPGMPLAPGKIRNSNRYALAAALEGVGELAMLEHLADSPEALRDGLARAAEACDVVITVGGVSVGDYDFVKGELQAAGELGFWRIAVKPGKPLAFGRLGGKPFFGLPGNPVSALVTFELFVRPALRKMAGHRTWHRPRVQAISETTLSHRPGREEYLRAALRWDRNRRAYLAQPLSGQGSAMVGSMAQSNGYLIVPRDVESVQAGEVLDALLVGP
ncbi:MAG TPA: gephyrin-like molybdotransferase Glp [Armatimonadota bacterium]|jgi:molybdopterin molybdotransferase